MNINETFVLTESWSKKLKNDLDSFYKTVYFGPLIFMLVNIIFCFAIQKSTSASFLTLYIPVTTLSTLYCVLVPRKAIRIYSDLIESFEFKSKTELSISLIDGRKLIISNPEFKNGYLKIDNNEKSCKLLTNSFDKNVYTVIPEFFINIPVF